MKVAMIDFFTYLPNRSIIEISGADRATFLQGLITNDINLLKNDSIIYTLMLSPQGRFQYDFFVIDAGDNWLIDVDSSRIDSLMQRLKLFKLHAKIDFLKNDNMLVCASSAIVHDGLCFADPRTKDLKYRCYYSKPFAKKSSSAGIYENLRISLGIPDGVKDMTVDKSIPLEWGMDDLGAISWNKGCYMGQELTARSRYVGQIRKRVLIVDLQHTTDLEFGAKLQINGEDVGRLCSHNENFGIALLRLEAFAQQDLLTIKNNPVKIIQPDWVILNK